MEDPPVHNDSGDEPDAGPDPGRPPWVTVFAIVGVAVVLLVVVLVLAGHGPGRHATGAPWDQPPVGDAPA